MVLCIGACSSSPDTAAPPDAAAAADQTNLLVSGRRVYNVHCARCHGPDGKDETYPFIARLDGIGRRMTPEEILEATWASGFVSPRSMNEDERYALGQYVSTL